MDKLEEARKAALKVFDPIGVRAAMGELDTARIYAAIDAYEAKLAELGMVRVPRDGLEQILYDASHVFDRDTGGYRCGSCTSEEPEKRHDADCDVAALSAMITASHPSHDEGS
jgi:dienelactone hydrolase